MRARLLRVPVGETAAAPWPRRAFAFTLVELLVVVTLIAIIAALVTPLLASASSTQLRAAAGTLAADIDFARNRGLTDATAPHLLVLVPDGPGYRIATEADPETAVSDPATRTPYEMIYGVGSRGGHLGAVSLGALSVGGDDRLGFGRFGELDQADDASIELTADSFSITVTIDAITGEASIGPLE